MARGAARRVARGAWREARGPVTRYAQLRHEERAAVPAGERLRRAEGEGLKVRNTQR
jgi:hypothetical protein